MNEYLFMVQARGIQIRENVKNIGAQVLEQVVRGAYSANSTGEQAGRARHQPQHRPRHTAFLGCMQDFFVANHLTPHVILSSAGSIHSQRRMHANVHAHKLTNIYIIDSIGRGLI